MEYKIRSQQERFDEIIKHISDISPRTFKVHFLHCHFHIDFHTK